MHNIPSLTGYFLGGGGGDNCCQIENDLNGCESNSIIYWQEVRYSGGNVLCVSTCVCMCIKLIYYLFWTMPKAVIGIDTLLKKDCASKIKPHTLLLPLFLLLSK